MNTPFFSLLFVVFITSCLALQTLAQGEAQTPTNPDNALLWKVSGKEMKQPSYLYGTIHIICPEDLIMTETMKQKFEETEQVYMELDMDDIGLLLKMSSAKTMNMEKGKSLKKLVSAADYNLLTQFFKDSLDLNIKSYDKTKPFFTMSTIYPKMLTCAKPSAYEVEFLMMAKKQKKQIYGLEGLDAQLAAINAISAKEQAEGLVKFVKDYSKGKNEMAELIQVYKEQNLSHFAEMMTEQEGEMEGFEENFLIKRNSSWIPVITKAVTEKPTFFAFGAAHLGGEFGIITLLRKAGYKVEPMNR